LPPSPRWPSWPRAGAAAGGQATIGRAAPAATRPPGPSACRPPSPGPRAGSPSSWSSAGSATPPRTTRSSTRTTTADSTVAALEAGGTTCDQRLDRAAYWAPALLDHGQPVSPTKAVAYYRPGVGVDPRAVEPYPLGLAMLGGDQTAAAPQSLDVVAWTCGTGSAPAATPPTCPEGRPLRMAVSFPDCWDGEHLDSADHVSHVARSRDGACPAAQPVPVPQLLLTISYPVTGGGHDLTLASGSLLTGHADFLNVWDEDKLRIEVETCLVRGVTCGVASNRA
jgi:Domain of unknown function (DUF1996)